MCIKAIFSENFKLIRSVLKIGSFEFASFQYFKTTFMNLKIVRLVLNAKCEIVVVKQFSHQRLLCDKQNIVHLVFTCLQVMKKYLKLRKHAFKSIDKFI